TVILTNTVVSGNQAVRGGGGGILAPSVFVINSTVSGNTAAAAGGGINANTLTLTNSTVSGNTASAGVGGGISATTATLNGSTVSDGHNLIGVVNGGTGFGAAGDQLGSVGDPLDPRLAPLAFNGGRTQTHALLAGSPAIDKGDNAGAPATDQRGVARPRDGD